MKADPHALELGWSGAQWRLPTMENGMTALTTISHGDALTMSSLEIAGLTGKAHRIVMRDIRSILNALKIEPVGGETRFGSTYLDAKGQVRECFTLPKRERMDEIGSRPFHEWGMSRVLLNF
ncbi:Rha family transcriptional regulator [Nitrobacter hamburgensis]|uniref:Rha family transcriptional regulator n=1 Tax=Nitrobacter hamburgensis TaxID=912 RepID=UPI001FD90D4B|nr:Rha family transcriptional regulator [Nitrobacter hamburgensis]